MQLTARLLFAVTWIVLAPLAGGVAQSVIRAEVIGDWTFEDGVLRAAGAFELVLRCTSDANHVGVQVGFPGLTDAAPGTRFEVTFAGATDAAFAAEGRLDPSGRVVLDDDAEDRLLALLAASDALEVTLTPSARDAEPRSFTLFTAAFGDAYARLGCGLADSCPMRGCGH